jgi:hypothetical protein
MRPPAPRRPDGCIWRGAPASNPGDRPSRENDPPNAGDCCFGLGDAGAPRSRHRVMRATPRRVSCRARSDASRRQLGDCARGVLGIGRCPDALERGGLPGRSRSGGAAAWRRQPTASPPLSLALRRGFRGHAGDVRSGSRGRGGGTRWWVICCGPGTVRGDVRRDFLAPRSGVDRDERATVCGRSRSAGAVG